MDPNAALGEIRELTGRIDSGEVLNWDDQMRLATLISGLDTWLVRAGALPTAWSADR